MRVALFLVVLVAAMGGGYFAWQYYTDASPAVITTSVPSVPSAPPAPPLPGNAPAIAAAEPPAATGAIDAFPPSAAGNQAPQRGQDRKIQVKENTPNPFDAASLASSKSISAALPRGMRAMTVPAGPLAEVIQPGDKVDVLIAHNVRRSILDLKGIVGEGPPDAKYRPTIAEVLIANVPVLSVRRDTQPASLVIGVGPGDMQKISLAEGVGTLSVALRSVEDKDRRGKPRLVTSRVLSQIRVRNDASTSGVKVIRGVGGHSAVEESDALANKMTEDEESDTNEGEQE